jgi:hypothetical protein
LHAVAVRSRVDSGDTRPYFRGVYDHAIRINEMVDSSREILATALEANFSLISISQNEIQNASPAGRHSRRAHDDRGVYGMNFKFMPELTGATDIRSSCPPSSFFVVSCIAVSSAPRLVVSGYSSGCRKWERQEVGELMGSVRPFQ